MKKYTEEEKRKLYDISLELMEKKGQVYCPFLEAPLRKWLEENKTKEINKYEYGKQFFRRAAGSAWRAAVQWAVIEGIEKRSSKSRATGSKKEEECIAYMIWMADYLLKQFTKFYLDRVKEISEKSYAKYGNVMPKVYKKYGPDDLLNDLPDIFTGPQIEEMEKLKNYSYDRYQFVKRAKEKGQIIEIGNKTYQKVSSLQTMDEPNDMENDMDMTI